MPEFFATAPIAAVALLAVNDLWLKAQFHNWLTGKLSDVAGCFFLPLYISALLALATPWSLKSRLAIGASFTLILFTSIKLSPSAASLVCALVLPAAHLLGIARLKIAHDPTDLLALPFILLAVHFGLRSARPHWERTP